MIQRASLVLLFALVAAGCARHRPAGPSPANAPAAAASASSLDALRLPLAKGSGTFDPTALRGKVALVNFWSPD